MGARGHKMWSASEIRELERLAEKGWTVPEAAAKLGRSIQSIYNKCWENQIKMVRRDTKRRVCRDYDYQDGQPKVIDDSSLANVRPGDKSAEEIALREPPRPVGGVDWPVRK